MEPGMVDPGFPSAQGGGGSKMPVSIWFDPSYFRSVPGILKIVAVVSTLLSFLHVVHSYISKFIYKYVNLLTE